ncbi:MAG: hypothetical protein V3T72_02955 [Thermoanaerobaculia bacterium]
MIGCAPRLDPRGGAPVAFVEAEVAGEPAAVAGALRAFFNDGLRRGPNKFPAGDRLHHFYLYPREAPPGSDVLTLPDDFQLAAGSPNDPAMARYLELPAERRAGDLFLYHPLDVYWPSEDSAGGRPVDFTCHFVLHLEPAGPGRTLVEVLQYQAMVRVGQKLTWSAHGLGPAFVDRLLPVPPTAGDRRQLLARIEATIAAGPGG